MESRGRGAHLFGLLQGLHDLNGVNDVVDRHQLARLGVVVVVVLAAASSAARRHRGQRHGQHIHGWHDGVAARRRERARAIATDTHVKQCTAAKPSPTALAPRPPHLSGMLRMRWLNSLRAEMGPRLLGWCAARRMSWSQKLFISAAAAAPAAQPTRAHHQEDTTR